MSLLLSDLTSSDLTSSDPACLLRPQVNQTFMWYHGYGDANGSKWEPPQRPTGAYIFNPVGEALPIEVKVSCKGPPLEFKADRGIAALSDALGPETCRNIV